MNDDRPTTPRGMLLEAEALVSAAERLVDKAEVLRSEAERIKGIQRAAIVSAANHALDYLLNAQSEDFARGSDREVREQLAQALGREDEVS